MRSGLEQDTGACPAPLAPLGPPLDKAEVERYSRHLLIPGVGEEGQRRLRAARVLVMGAGGLGSPVLLYLAAAGVGTIGIVDFDRVDASNLQRQVIHGGVDVGRSKVDSAADAVRRVNDSVRVRRHEVTVTAENALEVFADYDVVLDGTDNFATRYLVNDACALLGKPYVWGSIFRFEGQVSVFWSGHGPTYRDLYPVPPPPGSVPSCAEGGVFGVLCGVVGSIMATEAIKLICGIGRPLLGRLLTYDAATMEFRTVDVHPDPSAEPVRELTDYDSFCGVGPRPDDPAVLPFALSPADLQRWRASGRPHLLVDVRSEGEQRIATIDDAVRIPLATLLHGDVADDLPHDRDVVLYCRSGARSAQALASLRARGMSNVYHLDGGVLAWADVVDDTLARY